MKTIKFIEELERIAHAPVSLISTRFPEGESAKLDIRNIIDRRNWLGGECVMTIGPTFKTTLI